MSRSSNTKEISPSTNSKSDIIASLSLWWTWHIASSTLSFSKNQAPLNQNIDIGFISEKVTTSYSSKVCSKGDTGGQPKKIPKKPTWHGHNSNSTISINFKAKQKSPKGTTNLIQTIHHLKRRRRSNQEKLGKPRLQFLRLLYLQTTRRSLPKLTRNTTTIFLRKLTTLRNYWNTKTDWNISMIIFSKPVKKTSQPKKYITISNITTSLVTKKHYFII